MRVWSWLRMISCQGGVLFVSVTACISYHSYLNLSSTFFKKITILFFENQERKTLIVATVLPFKSLILVTLLAEFLPPINILNETELRHAITHAKKMLRIASTGICTPEISSVTEGAEKFWVDNSCRSRSKIILYYWELLQNARIHQPIFCNSFPFQLVNHGFEIFHVGFHDFPHFFGPVLL